ncbi:MAG: DUF4956 domain-containing protein [Erysipelotrichaceae bacterium]|nr:DUF4956 domain-containing protein [Erysipelotrichaceae bacterium]
MSFKEELFTILLNQTDLGWQTILANLLAALIVGLVIYVTYGISHMGTIYSRKFNVSLIVLTVLTAMALTVIGNNMAMSLGMVGALSIVRFRTAIKDSRDTVFIFWAIIAGICCGAQDYIVASLGSAIVFLVISIAGFVKNEQRVLLVIKARKSKEAEIQSVVFKLFNRQAVLRVKNSSRDDIEFIYEINQRIMLKAETRGSGINDTIYAIGDIDYVNIVLQNDEVSN